MSCNALGDVVAALVDGELDHGARERAQSHLLHCDTCRAEVEAQRRLKARLGGLLPPEPSPDLTARLLAMTVPGAPSPGRLDQPPPGPVRPATLRPAARPAGARRPGLRRSARRGSALRRRAAVGSTLAVLGTAVLLVLGGPRADEGVVPVDPAGDGFVVDFAGRTAEVPARTEPVVADLVP
jgi:anti-sigma factor RsiW